MMRTRRIAVLMGQDLGYCRQVLRGVQAYSLQAQNWVFRDAPAEPAVLKVLEEWKPHGVIAHIFIREVGEAMATLGVPVVNTTSTIAELPLPLVEVDHVAVGRMAAEHFLERGFSNFGFFGSRWTDFSRNRERGFRERLEEENFTVSSCYAEYLPRPPIAASWKGIDQQVSKWLKVLPKPVAILASNDVPAMELSDSCRQLQLRVPEDVALIGVDNDELQCNLSRPPLSSVEIPAHRIGYEAARMLDQLMRGEKPEPRRLFLPPVRVVTRRSTDTVAIDDEDVSAALGFIRRTASDGAGVESVLMEVPVSRRVLERKFRRLLGRTILDEMRRVRVEHAKQLLTETDLPMMRVATLSGFSNARRMAVVFHQFTRMTPTAYRNQSHLGRPTRAAVAK